MFGVIAAVPTPVNATGEPLKKLFLEHCTWALRNGCDGLNILGSTGEANSFDTQTRKKIMGWAGENLDRSRLMVGTGTPSIAETIELTMHADALGYGVALVLPPYYYKPLSNTGLTDWYTHLHNGLGKRGIRIFFYNFPQMTGVKIAVSVIKYLHQTWPMRFAGIKDSSGDLEYCRELAAALPKFSVFPSSEVSLGEADKSAFAGCISATTNLTAPLCAEAWANRKSPDPKLIDKIAELRACLTGPELIASVKYLVSQRTGQAAWQNILPPFSPLTRSQKSKLQPVADQLDYG